MTHTFRAIWPITDETATYASLCAQARAELPLIAARSHARLTGHGRFWFAPSETVPGSGRITPTVLVYEAPATTALHSLPGGQNLPERTFETTSHRACSRCGIVRDARPSSDLCRDCHEIERRAS